MSSGSRSPHLPTRCPACKGAVVQRMSARPHGGFIWFQCLFCNHTWRFHLEDPRAIPDGELMGEVFVVTADGSRQALGRVELKAIPEDALREHLERKTAQSELESRKLQRKIDALAATLEKARVEEARLWKIQKRDESDLRKANAWSVAYNTTKTLSRELEDLDAKRQHLKSGEFFFQEIPSPISVAQTDGEGKFTLFLPRDRRFGIVARASRDPGEKQETYFWFVWVSLGGEPSKRLVLNNDNTVGAQSPDSALR